MSREEFTENNFEESSANSADNRYEGKPNIVSGDGHLSSIAVLNSKIENADGEFVTSNTSTNLRNAPSSDMSKPDEDLTVCAFCGAHNLAGSNFCMVCGKKLNQAVVTSRDFSKNKADNSNADSFFVKQPNFLEKTDHIPQDFRKMVLAGGDNYRFGKETGEKADEKTSEKVNGKADTVVVGCRDTDKRFVPILTRIKTNERTVIDKPLFKIGTAIDTCDLVITGNRYISRVHAYIVVRNDRYFIIDRNSTNKTYVDGKAIPIETEVEIFDNTLITLANEDMVFNLEF